MTRMRGVAPFPELWARRTTLSDEAGASYELMAVEDLVRAKKTQREKDWPIITTLVEGHYHALRGEPTPERIAFWLLESRVPERLRGLALEFAAECRWLQNTRPLLTYAATGDLDTLRSALDAETRAEQAKDRAYWEPLRRDLEDFRRQERGGKDDC